MAADNSETRVCYICGAAWPDKVKLGVHIMVCYDEAVKVRGELWHPHPLDLLDNEQRYTEYMRGQFRRNEQRIRDARAKGVSFVTADAFEAMRGQLGPVRQQQQQQQQQQQARPASQQQARPEAGHAQQLAQPVRQVATGVTLLRHELSAEIERLRELREREESNAAQREAAFARLVGNFESALGAAASPARLRSEAPRPPEPRPVQPPPPPAAAAAACVAPLPAPATDAGGEAMPDGRIRCTACGKQFGVKGFAAHSQRCVRGPDDFSYSRDARFEQAHPAAQQPVPALQAAHYAGPAEESGPPRAKWTLKATFPMAVLPERPLTTAERNRAAEAAAQKRAMAEMVEREMSGLPPPPAEQREPTVACGRCGRFFYASRVAKHEATCVAKPKR